MKFCDYTAFQPFSIFSNKHFLRNASEDFLSLDPLGVGSDEMLVSRANYLLLLLFLVVLLLLLIQIIIIIRSVEPAILLDAFGCSRRWDARWDRQTSFRFDIWSTCSLAFHIWYLIHIKDGISSFPFRSFQMRCCLSWVTLLWSVDAGKIWNIVSSHYNYTPSYPGLVGRLQANRLWCINITRHRWQFLEYKKNMLDIQYLGAAHGLTGILQILLSVPGYFQVYISKYFHVLLATQSLQCFRGKQWWPNQWVWPRCSILYKLDCSSYQ